MMEPTPEPTQAAKVNTPRNRAEFRRAVKLTLGRKRLGLRFTARVAAAVRAFYQEPGRKRPSSRRKRRERARRDAIAAQEAEAQRRSFAFGNATLANPLVTRELVEEVADAHGELPA